MERIMMAMFCSMLLFHTCLSESGVLTTEEDSGAGTMTMTLLHRDHVMSLLGDKKSTSVADRMAEAVRRSHARRKRFDLLSQLTENKSGKVSSPPDVAAPVNASSGEYVMAFSLGTPSVSFIAIMDTGSDLVWLQCKPCLECLPQRDSLFDPAKSSTFKKLPCSNHFCADLQQNCTLNSAKCPYSYDYGDSSSTNGLLASETTTFNTTDGKISSLTGLAFGCGSKNQGYFARADGLVGFGRGPLSLPSQIGPFVGKEFSYCLGDFVHATNQSSTLTIGTHIEKDTFRLKFTPLISNDYFPTFYYVELKSIQVGSETLKIHSDIFSLDSMGNGGTIMDSGTTLTYLPQAAYDALLSQLREIVNYPVVQDTTSIGLDLCFDVSGNPFPEFPAIAFHFHGVTLTLPTQNTFMTFESKGTSLSCLAMGATTGSQSFGIFGNFQQQNLQVLYDLERSLLGFKEQKCL